MDAVLRILAAGPGVTLQDAGRRGLLRFGVTPAGPMDAAAFALANRSVGAAEDACAMEVSLGGAEIAAEGAPLAIAVAGGAFELRLDGTLQPQACVLALEPGRRLALRAGPWGAFAYVAVGGRINCPKALGSRATHARSRLGGLEGRGLRAGDILPIADPVPPPASPLRLAAPALERRAAPLRLLLGPQEDYFTPQAIEALFSAEWRLAAHSDRMAYRLEGPRLTHARGHDIVSDGIAMGAIQVAGDGAPLVLMADRQPTGGYPKIAHVVTADLGALAQRRPGETLRFSRATWREAVAARAALKAQIARGADATPLAGAPDSEVLLRENLVGGVIDAADPWRD